MDKTLRVSDFQFPLWDTCLCLYSFNENSMSFNSLYGIPSILPQITQPPPEGLSIPFMGYQHVFNILSKQFNNFQFPLWDTQSLVNTKSYLLYYFQFPLWDTYLCQKCKDNEIIFQFPLWDTWKVNFDNYTIQYSLSIPFMGYLFCTLNKLIY